MEKTHFKKLRNPNYIGSYELMTDNDKTIELVVTITSVGNEVVEYDGKKDTCMVARLQGQKPIILNSTNSKVIAKLYGVFIEDWIGKSITLFVQKIRAFGETVDALRIRPTVPVIKLPELTPQSPIWEKVKEAVKDGSRTVAKLREKHFISPENEALLLAVTPPENV